MQRHVSTGNVVFGNDLPLVLISGPCQLESRDHALECASALVEITKSAGISFVFKTSFDKANRTSLNGARGLGLDQALSVFSEIKTRYNISILTDIHEVNQCQRVAEVVDILQIPAFLSRQTDLLIAAGKTGALVNIKKGQFMAPWDVINAANKIANNGNENILITERGVSFGYNTLVVDMRGLPIMAETGYPIIFDATHSVQQPGGMGTSSGGDRRMVPVLARAAASVGVAGIFAETHPDPDKAPSDGPNMLALKAMPKFIDMLKSFDTISKKIPISLDP